MTDLSITLLSGAFALAALGIIALTSLRGWSMWVALRRHEMEMLPAGEARMMSPAADDTQHTGNRIELADLRERVRQLEAIAAGVDL